jgi:phosphoglycolate phosphatase-like HAD superfamily hydrolase
MKAILFDIDGTLIESMAVDTELYLASIGEILGPVSVRERLSDYDHVTDTGILVQLLDDNGYSFDEQTVAAVRSVFVDKIQRHIEANGPFVTIDGAIEFVSRAHAAEGRRVAIATGGWRESALLKLESAGFDIDGIPLVSSDDAASRIEIMQAALAQLGAEFDSVTYFGDAEWDRRACQSLGWNFIAVGPGLGGIDSYAGIDH